MPRRTTVETVPRSTRSLVKLRGVAGSRAHVTAMRNRTWMLWWLHVPKCATSFRESVLDYPMSPERGTSEHQPLPAGTASRMDQEHLIHGTRAPGTVQVVAFFRQPESRLLSSYLWMKDNVRDAADIARRGGYLPLRGDAMVVNCCWGDWGWTADEWRPIHRQIASSAAIDPSVLAPFIGCQTRMVLGRGCMSRRPVVPAETARAIDLVSRFRFVGDIAQWDASICLFNYIMTGRRFKLRRQLANARPTARAMYDAASGANATSRMPIDLIDGALYDYVRQRLATELSRHGITDARCPMLDDMSQLPRVINMPAEAKPRLDIRPSRSADSTARRTATRGHHDHRHGH